MTETLPEVWLRGPVNGVPALLQPAAHALLQAAEELEALMAGFMPELLWKRVAGMASPGFHLLHIAGVLDRLHTYATGNMLTQEQLDYLRQEETPQDLTPETLIEKVTSRIERFIEQFRSFPEAALTEKRMVGRKGLPSTVQGLLFHAAEHTMRHLGQLLVTVAILNKNEVR